MKEILKRVWENLFSRLSGPLNFRFIVQPAVAGFLDPGRIKGCSTRPPNILVGSDNKSCVPTHPVSAIIDGIAPYRWTGPNAQGRWFSDAEKWIHDFGVESEAIVCDRIAHATVVETHAYAVLSATLFFTLKAGHRGSKPGVLTFTFVKQGDTWKVESQAWGR